MNIYAWVLVMINQVLYRYVSREVRGMDEMVPHKFVSNTSDVARVNYRKTCAVDVLKQSMLSPLDPKAWVYLS